jgi:anti-anti-sigma regulatory factor
LSSCQIYSSCCSADFLDRLPKVPFARPLSRLPGTKHRLQSGGMARALGGADESWEETMLDLGIEKIGELGVVECEGRIARSEAAFKLHEAVTSLRDARIIVLDLSEVCEIEGGGLGMLLFLQRWAYDHDIQLKLFNPRMSVRERLECVSSMPQFDIATLPEVMALMVNANSRFALAA